MIGSVASCVLCMEPAFLDLIIRDDWSGGSLMSFVVLRKRKTIDLTVAQIFRKEPAILDSALVTFDLSNKPAGRSNRCLKRLPTLASIYSGCMWVEAE